MSRGRPPRPESLLVFFHGGGWVQGSVDSHDSGCRWVADRAGVRVLSVGYRRAPEHVFPAAFDDALAAYLAAAESPGDFGADRVAVGGDSAGGNLAAAAVPPRARRRAVRSPLSSGCCTRSPTPRTAM